MTKMAPGKSKKGKKLKKKVNSAGNKASNERNGVGDKSKNTKGKANGGTNKKKAENDEGRRDENWLSGEMDVLVDMCISNISLLESNLSAEVTKETKNAKWSAIIQAVNA